MSTAQAQWFAQESVELVNAARNRAGLPRLVPDPALDRVAQAYSRRMAEEGFYGHVDPQGRSVGDRLAAARYLAGASAENIARGQPDPGTVVQGWLDSPGHCANIMNPQLAKIGAGYAFTPVPPFHHYWTHVFATPDASVGRDRSQYPAQALAAINQARHEYGAGPLTMDPALERIARTQLGELAQASRFRSEGKSALGAAGRAALAVYRRALALTAAGAASPEQAADQWTGGSGGEQILDRGLRAAGIAYTFVEEDDFRHYWLLVVGG